MPQDDHEGGWRHHRSSDSQASSDGQSRFPAVYGAIKTLPFHPAALALGALLFLAGCAAYGPAHPGEKIYRNLVYATPPGHALHLDLYVPPPGARPAPVVIWIFGGSWKIGNKGYHVNVRELTRSGLAVAAIEYRLSGTAKYPAQLEDCEAAAAWLRKNGARYGLDPQRLGASGESAGGHLAALLGTVEGRERIRAVCALYPVTDLLKIGREYANPKRPSDIERLLGGPIEQKRKLAEEGSPVNHVNADSPPFLLIHGREDQLVPLSHSTDLQARLQRAGVEARLLIVPGKGHWFLLDRSQLAEVAAFFRRHFGMPPLDR